MYSGCTENVFQGYTKGPFKISEKKSKIVKIVTMDYNQWYTNTFE